MKVLIIGVGNPIPTFITRRLNALAEADLKLVVALAYGKRHKIHANIKVLRYGNLNQMRLADALGFMGSVIVHPLRFVRVFRLVSSRKLLTRLKLAVRFFPLALVKHVDLIHVQWLGLVPDVQWLKTILRAPIVASVRGSQVTVYPLTRATYSDLISRAFQQADACHLVSYDLKKPCIALGALPAKLFVNYNGIDLERFKPNGRKKTTSGITLISIGSLIWRKGYLFQLMILQQLRASGVQVQLHIVGSGIETEGLTYTANTLGVADCVFFEGHLAEGEIIERLQGADVYISTSMAEGLPNSLVEAAACGLPIVTFNCEGTHEIIEHGVTGFIIPPGDVAQAAASLTVLLNMDTRMAMGMKARERMLKLFDQRMCVTDMMAHYKRIAHART
jgi:glycosyltransferase involved in cell wall biosynthesis